MRPALEHSEDKANELIVICLIILGLCERTNVRCILHMMQGLSV